MSHLVSVLSQAQLLTAAQQQQVLEHVSASDIPIPEALLDLGLFQPHELTQHLSRLFGLAIIDLAGFHIESVCQQLAVGPLIIRYQSLPLEYNDQVLTLAVSDPTCLSAEHEFRFATGLQVDLVLADHRSLQAAIRRLYGRTLHARKPQDREIRQQDLTSLVQLADEEHVPLDDFSQDDSPVSRFINQVLLDAVRKGASDIHFEPYESDYRIRLRCDGLLVESQRPATQLSRRLAARIKILANLDIAQRRLPQDGRIKLQLDSGTAIDIRASTLPTLWGEKIVLRLLDSSRANLNIDNLGYNPAQKQLYLAALNKPQGLILMTGPTGSGKTVSLYSGLNVLNTDEVNISTAEDPVEINLPGINQVQVQPKIGFGFAQALRSFLRQDPDVVMVGEIRDTETADIAVKAAQTGHLVLSTLHTNSAAETIVRLTDMGIEPFNLASSLSLIIAQRLARRLCPCCKTAIRVPDALQQTFGLEAHQVIFAANTQGCTECTHGYSGRVGIYEVMALHPRLSAAILQRASVQQIEAIAQEQGMQTLLQSGIEKLCQGVTSFSELQRVLYF